MTRRAADGPRPVVVNGRFLSQRFSGVQRYALELTRALDALLAAQGGPALDVSLLLPPDAREPPELARIRVVRRGRRRGHTWEQVDLPLAARGAALVNLCNTAPILHARQIMTVHDAGVFAHPECYGSLYRTWHRLLHGTAGRTARLIVTVSEFSRGEVENFCPFMKDKIAVIPNAADHIVARPAASSPPGAGAGGYVLAVASTNPLKNVALIPRAMELLGPSAPPLVVVGSGARRVFAAGYTEGLKATFLHDLSDAALRRLYQDAACLVFPSVYEGFGIPPLEAMLCGCPVLAARSSSIPEVCGEAVLYFDPGDPRELAAALRQLTADPSLRGSLVEAGRARAAAYSWRSSAVKLLGLVGWLAGDAGCHHAGYSEETGEGPCATTRC